MLILTLNFETTACRGTTILRGSTGVISSPNYPRNYPSWSNCRWKIIAPAGYKFIIIQFNDFRLESGGSSCSYDYVEIRDGGLPTSPLLNKLCGTKRNQFVVSRGSVVYVRFRSDGSANFKGFRAVWRAGSSMQGRYYSYCSLYKTWSRNQGCIKMLVTALQRPRTK